MVITNRTSFESVPQRYREVLEKEKPSNIFFLVVGHKSDLVVEGEVMPGGRGEAGCLLGRSLR